MITTIFFYTFTFLTICISYILYKRRKTKYMLSSGRCNLPTVMWLPKFLNYHPIHDEHQQHQPSNNSNQNDTYCHSTKKMGSSSITNVLPRMERLNGPYGMYATVYGISTKVIHIAHPTPARIVLTGDTTNISSSISSSSSKTKKGIAYSLGAIKNPAYDHFDNLFGNAVFTADGQEWKSKRASVLHCLLKGCTKDESKESIRLEREANYAADRFMHCALVGMQKKKKTKNHVDDDDDVLVVNVVKLLQRSTIGLIYRFLTHDESFQRHDHEYSSNNMASIDYDQKNNDDNNDNDDDSSYESSSSTTTDSTTSISSQSSSNLSNDQQQRSTSSTKKKNDTTKKNKRIQNKEDINDKTKNNPHHLLSSYLEAITNIRMIILAQSRSIWFLLPRWFYKLCSPMYQEEEREMKTIRDFAKCACINAKLGSPLHSLRLRSSHSNNDHDLNVSNKKNDGTTSNDRDFSSDHDHDDDNHVNKKVLDEAITLLFAGQDTSAATLSWTLHLLSLYPHVQTKLAKEISDAIQDYDSKNQNPSSTNASSSCSTTSTTTKASTKKYRSISKKMVIKLPYLDAVLKESMRLYPVAPFVVRNLPHEVTLPTCIDEDNTTEIEQTSIDKNKNHKNNNSNNNKTVTLPKDSLACIWIYGLHRNKKFWHQPNEFIPERWIDPKLQNLDAGQRNNASFLPFAAGSRNCVGQPLAHIVLRIVLAKIIYLCEFTDERLESVKENFRTEEDRKEAILALRKDMQAGFTVLPTGGVHLSVKERKIE